jgi:hypothetical protein
VWKKAKGEEIMRLRRFHHGRWDTYEVDLEAPAIDEVGEMYCGPSRNLTFLRRPNGFIAELTSENATDDKSAFVDDVEEDMQMLCALWLGREYHSSRKVTREAIGLVRALGHPARALAKLAIKEPIPS